MPTITTDTPTYALGDEVAVHPDYARAKDRGRVWTVTKVPTKGNETMFVITPKGGGQAMRARAYQMVKHDPSAVGTAELVDIEPSLHKGTLVQAPALKVRGGTKTDPNALWVVVNETAGKYSISPLGGGEGVWLTRVSRKALTVVDPSRITLAPPA